MRTTVMSEARRPSPRGDGEEGDLTAVGSERDLLGLAGEKHPFGE